MKDEFGLSASGYYQLRGRVIDDPAALVEDPVTVKRLRRLRDTQRQARAS